MFDEREEEKDGQDESGLAGEKRERERHGDFHVDKIHRENSFQKFFPTKRRNPGDTQRGKRRRRICS